MKKKLALIGMVVVFALLFSSIAVLAAAPSDKPTPNSHSKNDPEDKPGKNGAKKGKVQNFKGIVIAKDASGLTLTLKDGSLVAVVINEDTKIKIPTVKNATVEEINLESQAVVQARTDDTDTLVANKIQVIPGKPTKIHRVGVVTAYTAGSSITVEDKSGGSTSFSLDANTKMLPNKRADSLAVGDRVTIISRRDPTSGPLTAQGVVIHGSQDGEE